MAKRSRLIRCARPAATLLAIAGILTCWAVISLLELTLPSLVQGPIPPATPVVWNTLPTPFNLHPNWTSFTDSSSINDLALRDGLLWSATDGGVVVWDVKNEESIKFTSEHGLAANRVTSVAVAPNGVLWFGTLSSGLSRYDGAQWQTFTPEGALAANEVRDIVAAKDGTVWVATSNGVRRYNGQTWKKFSALGTFRGLGSDDVRALALTADGGLWAATSNGVSFFDGDRWDNFRFQDGLANDNVFDIAVAPDGSLWAGTEFGLSHYDGAQWKKFITSDGLVTNEIHTLAVTPDGMVWLGYGDAGRGLTRFDGWYGTTFTVADGLAHHTVQSLSVGPNGDLWIGTASGVSRFDGATWHSFTAPSEIASNDIRGLVTARGAIWAATATGISSWDGIDWRLFTSADGLVSNDVRALTVGPDGAPWAAFEPFTRGLSRLVGAENWEHVPCVSAAPLSTNITAGAPAPDGSVWFATDQGVSQFDGTTWRAFTTADGLPKDAVQTLAVAPSGEIWIGTSNGLALFAGDHWTTVTHDDVQRIAISPDNQVWAITPSDITHLDRDQLVPVGGPDVARIRAMVADVEGLWVATPDGVARFDGNTWQTNTVDDGLLMDEVTELALAPDGAIWAGFARAKWGFSYFDGEQWRIFPVQTLANNNVEHIFAAPDGAIWMATSNGISRFEDGAWRSFDITYGLPSNHANDITYAFGSIWAATDAGLARFDGQLWYTFDSLNGLRNDRTRSLAVAPNGELWVGFVELNSGLNIFDGNNWRAVDVWDQDATLTVMKFSPDGRLWIGGSTSDEEAFLGVYDGQGWDWRAIAGVPLDIAVAPDGRLWVALEQALPLVIDAHIGGLGNSVGPTPIGDVVQQIEFAADGTVWYVVPPAWIHNLSGEVWDVTELLRDGDPFTLALEIAPDGSVWVGGTQFSGVARYQDGEWQKHARDSEFSRSRHSLPSGKLHAMTFASDSTLWISGGSHVRHYNAPQNQEGYAVLDIGNILLNRHPARMMFQAADGAIWLVTYDRGAIRISDNVFQHYTPDPRLLTADLQSFAVATDSSAWLGTSEGIVRLTETECGFTTRARNIVGLAAAADPVGGVWFGTAAQGALHWETGEEATAWIVSDWVGSRVAALAVAPDGAIWFAGEEKLLRYGEGEWLSFDIDPEHVYADVRTIAVAPNQYVWLNAQNGVTYFDGRLWNSLTTADGLADSNVEFVAAAPDGALWFATPGGISRYRP